MKTLLALGLMAITTAWIVFMIVFPVAAVCLVAAVFLLFALDVHANRKAAVTEEEQYWLESIKKRNKWKN